MLENYERVVIFGDSIACGSGDTETGGFVALLHNFLGKHGDNIATINCSISGDSTRELVARFDHELKARINLPMKVIFEIGTNDCWTNADGTQNVPLEDFEQNIQKLIDCCLNNGIPKSDIVFLGIGNFDESKTVPASFADISYTNANREMYNAILKKGTQSRGVAFLFLPSFVPSDLPDGLHPNAAGAQKIFERVKNYFL